MIRPNRHACLFRRFAREARGAVSILAALMMVMALGLSVLVVDAGHLYLAKRRLQSAVDAAALAAAGDPLQASLLAGNSLAANGFSRDATVEAGTYTADPAIAQSGRFDPTTAAKNAVRVTKTVETPTFLAGIFGIGRNSVQAGATAARIPAVSFAAGTSVAQVDPGQLNQVLGGLFGVGTLRAISYDGLASANIDALPFLDQLATRAGITAGTYGDLANASVMLGQVLAAAAAQLNVQGGADAAAVDMLNALSLQLPQAAGLTLGQAIDLALWRKRRIGSVVQQASGRTQFNVLDIVMAAARLYGAGHIVSAGLDLNLPGVASATARLAVGSPMTGVALAPAGTAISTAQVRIAVTVKTNPLNLGADAPVQVTLPVYLTLAPGIATATAIPCAIGGTRATITAAAQAGSAQLGTVSDAALQDFTADPAVAPAQVAVVSLLHLVNLTITAAGSVPILGSDPKPLDFTQAMIAAGTPQTVAGSDNQHILSGLADRLTFPPQSGSLLGPVLSLLNNTVLPLLRPVLAAILTALDPTIDTLLRGLGLRLGAIDVVVRGVGCGTPTLVH